MAQQDDENVPQTVEVVGIGVLILIVLVFALQAMYFVNLADIEAEKSTHEMPVVYQESIAEQRKDLNELVKDNKIVHVSIVAAMNDVVKDLQAKQAGGK
jgi:hypothetical protein